MTISVREQHDPASPGGTATAGQPDWLTGIALMTGSAAANQFGAATAALAFPVLGPAGVVAVRQWVAGALLLATVRPKFASFTRQQWLPVLALALIFATMNLSLYVAIDTIGLGLAVTLEFLGPLSVALLASRRATDIGCAMMAGAAVVVLARPQPSTDYAGIILALMAAACWAGYILVNRVLGARLPGSQGPAAAAGLSALLYVPVGIWALASHPLEGAALGRAATAGILCSAVPMVADMRALRRVPARFFGVFMSVNPVFAALTGLIVLGQSLELADWLAVAAIVTANAVSISTGGRRAVPASAGGGPKAAMNGTGVRGAPAPRGGAQLGQARSAQCADDPARSDREPEAAVNHERLAGGIASGHERHAGIGDVLGGRDPVQRRDQFHASLALIPLLGPRSRDQAGCDRVDADPAFSVLSHDRGEVIQRGLGHGIRQRAARLPDPGERGDVDDPPVAGLAQERERSLADQKGPHHVGAQDLVPVIDCDRADVRQRHVHGDAGVVDQAVKAPPPLLGG